MESSQKWKRNIMVERHAEIFDKERKITKRLKNNKKAKWRKASKKI